MKPFINKETSDKIKIFGTDQSEWKLALLDEIEAEQLPVYYGGKMTDPDGDPKCPSKVNYLTVQFTFIKQIQNGFFQILF